MNISLDQDSLSVLRQAFQWTDYDQDGFISLQDLKNSTSIQKNQDAYKIFKALKTGSNEQNLITFQEFSERILDYPSLLKQIKKKICSTDSTDEDGNSLEYTSLQADQTEFNKDLTQINQFFQTALYGRSYTREKHPIVNRDQTEILLSTTKALYEKSIDDQIPISALPVITFGTFKLASKIWKEMAHGEQEKFELTKELENAYISCDSLVENVKKLEKTNKNLIRHVRELEKQNMRAQEENSVILSEKQYLKYKLDQVESQKTQATQKISKIQVEINCKQQAMEQLQREVNNLKSLKTIQEMKGNITSFAQQQKKRKEQPRCSYPARHIQFTPNKPRQQSFDFNSIQWYAKNQKIKSLQSKVNTLNSSLKKANANLSQLKQQNLELTLKLNQQRCLAIAQADICSSHPSCSLFAELRAIDYNYRDSTTYQLFKPQTSSKSSQCTILRPTKKNRSDCWVCF